MEKQLTVLLTGASSGIGYELTRCFARDGHKVVMVSLHEDKLEAAAANLRGEFPNGTFIPIACDLSIAGSVANLFNETQNRDLEIDVLVNNAGFGEHGYFASQTDLQKELAIIQVNVAALTHLTKLYLPYMQNRGGGRILNVASEAAFMPIPLLAVYAATKAYVLSLSESLQNELKGTSVSLTILCPAATDTNFFRVANMLKTPVANGELDSPADVAKAGYEGLMKGEARVLPTFKAKLHTMEGITLPDSFLAGQMRKQMEDTE